MRALDLKGVRFGRLLAIRPTSKRNGHNIIWELRCDDGNIVEASTDNLRSGNVQSCGCLRSELHLKRVTKHGDRVNGTRRTYSIWTGIKTRCYNKNHIYFKYYGGRGITMCNAWKNSYTSFKEYVMNLPNVPDNINDKGRINYQIDRINNNRNYEPGNVRWATLEEQARNMSSNITIKVKNRGIMTLKQIVDEYGKACYSTVWQRIERGWSIKRAILTPGRKLANPLQLG
jgi:hypothetical protein